MSKSERFLLLHTINITFHQPIRFDIIILLSHNNKNLHQFLCSLFIFLLSSFCLVFSLLYHQCMNTNQNKSFLQGQPGVSYYIQPTTPTDTQTLIVSQPASQSAQAVQDSHSPQSPQSDSDHVTVPIPRMAIMVVVILAIAKNFPIHTDISLRKFQTTFPRINRVRFI